MITSSFPVHWFMGTPCSSCRWWQEMPGLICSELCRHHAPCLDELSCTTGADETDVSDQPAFRRWPWQHPPSYTQNPEHMTSDCSKTPGYKWSSCLRIVRLVAIVVWALGCAASHLFLTREILSDCQIGFSKHTRLETKLVKWRIMYSPGQAIDVVFLHQLLHLGHLPAQTLSYPGRLKSVQALDLSLTGCRQQVAALLNAPREEVLSSSCKQMLGRDRTEDLAFLGPPHFRGRPPATGN